MRANGYRTPPSLRVSLFSLALAAALATAGARPKPKPVDALATRPAVHRVNSTTDGTATDVKPKRGIPPPWHENWIPELRRQPGARVKSTTA